MNTLHFQFNFDRDEFDKKIHIELYEGMEEEIEALLESAVPLLKPKAVYSEILIDHLNTGELLIGGQIFSDPQLLSHLENKVTVFPYVATCGDELDALAAESGDLLEGYWYDALKQMAMDHAFNQLRDHIKGQSAVSKLYSMNPGSDACGEGWDLVDQRKLFDLLGNVETEIGVRLTESMLMFPNKTVSGFMFESEVDFVSCHECDNMDCPNRKMIHEGAIYS